MSKRPRRKGVLQEAVRGPPVHTAHHLQEPAEGMKQRQEAEEYVVVADPAGGRIDAPAAFAAMEAALAA